MRLLLDTHIFLWFVYGDAQLSARARALIEDTLNTCFLSIASIWETAIKVGTGKLTLTQPVEVFFAEQAQRNSIGLLPIELAHAARVATLPFHHRDPFDRLLVAQSLTENVPLLSADAVLDAYSIVRYW